MLPYSTNQKQRFFTRALTLTPAFTLIELLVVIVVIAALAAVIIPKFQDVSGRSKQATSAHNIMLLNKAVAAFNVDTGLMPRSLDDLIAGTAPANGADPKTGASKPISVSDWHGPYFSATLPTDPVTGNAYSISVSSGFVGLITVSQTAQEVSGPVQNGGEAPGAQQE